MTITTTTRRVAYVGDGTTTAFAVTFPFFGTGSTAELEVIERVIATGVETTKTVTTDYTVSGGSGSTGTVTAVTAPASTVQWIIRGTTTNTQETDYTANDPFPAETHEAALDRRTLVAQELTETLGRALTFPKTDSSALDPELPSSVARASKLLGFDSSGNPEALAKGSITDSIIPTAFAETLLDDASASAARSTLGLVIGTDVLAPDGDGSALTGLPRPGNPIINPSFQVNQRAASSNADDTYGHDRWYALTQTGTIAVTTVADAEDGTPTMARLTQSQASAQRMGYAQIIEGAHCRHLRGRQVTFRFRRFRCSASQAIRFAVLEWTGTEDSATSDVVNDWTSASYTAGGFFLGSNLTVSGVTASTPSAATLTDGPELTVTLGSSFNNLIVFAWTEDTAAQNVTLDLADAQLVIGAAAPEFQRPEEADERYRCFRYFQRLLGNTAAREQACRTLTTTTFDLTIRLLREMRAQPAATANNPTNLSVNDGSVNAAVSALSFSVRSNRTIYGSGTCATVTAFRPSFMSVTNVNATIDVDAEL